MANRNVENLQHVSLLAPAVDVSRAWWWWWQFVKAAWFHVVSLSSHGHLLWGWWWWADPGQASAVSASLEIRYQMFFWAGFYLAGFYLSILLSGIINNALKCMEDLYPVVMDNFFHVNNHEKGGTPGGGFTGKVRWFSVFLMLSYMILFCQVCSRIISKDSLEELGNLLGEDDVDGCWIRYLTAFRSNLIPALAFFIKNCLLLGSFIMSWMPRSFRLTTPGKPLQMSSVRHLKLSTATMWRLGWLRPWRH